MHPARAVDIALQVLEGLAHAHHHGLVHRDLKPENMFITRDYRDREVVKLVDFGIAKILDASDQERLTRTGFVFGTPSFMSPEQALGNPVDERTDLYATGLVLYQLLAGRRPFVANERAELMRMQIMEPPPPLPHTVPAELVAIVMRLLEKQPALRFAHALDVAGELARIRPWLDHATTAPAPEGHSQIDTGAMTAAFDIEDEEETRVRRPSALRGPMLSFADGRASIDPGQSTSAPAPPRDSMQGPARSSAAHSLSASATSAGARDARVVKIIVGVFILLWVVAGGLLAWTRFF
jgi:serine/threonine protein kinase